MKAYGNAHQTLVMFGNIIPQKNLKDDYEDAMVSFQLNLENIYQPYLRIFLSLIYQPYSEFRYRNVIIERKGLQPSVRRHKTDFTRRN